MRRQQGYTLLEVTVVFVLLGTLVGLTVANLHSQPQRASARALAESLASELLSVREMARATGLPTAVAFPSENGSKGHTQAYYVLQGQNRPKLIQNRSAASDFPAGQIFVGHWPLAAGSTHSSALTLAAANQRDFTMAAWDVPYPDDPCLVFLSSGSVIFEGVVADNGVRLLICDGLDSRPAAIAGRNSHLLTEVHSPYTVSVEVSGEISVRAGLYAEAPGGVSRQAGAAVGSAPALGPSPPPVANSDPVNIQVKPYPEPDPVTLPPGIDATVKHGGLLTMEVAVSDLEGDELSCRWEASNDDGVFSTDEVVEMKWNPQRLVWQSSWAWSPPESANDGDVYILECEVTDNRGGSVTGQVGAAGRVQVLPRGSLCYTKAAGGQTDIYVSNADGTEPTRLTTSAGDETRPTWSPDGSKICFRSNCNGPQELFLMNPDGSDVQRVVDAASVGGNCQWSGFSPGGERLAFTVQTGAGWEIWQVRADGSNLSRVPGYLQTDLVWGLTWALGDRVIITENPPTALGTPSHGPIVEIDLNTGARVPLSPPGVIGQEPRLSHDRQTLVWTGSGLSVNLGDYTPGSLSNVRTVPGAALESPAWAPGDSQLTGQVTTSPGNRDLVVVNTDGSNLRVLSDPTGSDEDASDWALR